MSKLKYSYEDYHDVISSQTMKYHYEVLYKGYVDNFNGSVVKLQNARDNNDYQNIKGLEKNLSYQGAGAVLHTLFFENINPHPINISEHLLKQIESDFTSFDKFQEHFVNSTINIEGGGWGIMGYSKSLDKLIILQVEKHQDLTIWDFKPILVIDIWEHAYYLDYQTDKKTYINNIFKIIDWDVVDKRYKKTKIC